MTTYSFETLHLSIETIINYRNFKVRNLSNKMAHLNSGPTPPKLLAITINGSITVESEEDRKKREEKRKQRKSRWDRTESKYNKKSKEDDNVMTPILALPPPGGIRDNPAALASRLTMPTNIDTSKMSGTQQDIYVLQMQIHDATRNLAKPDLGIPPNPRDRSPSPEPIYNSNGKRLNTRLERTRNKLINQRNNAITKIKELDPTYQPPSHYNYKNSKLEDKVFIPADEHPEINFVGLLLGPRGNFLEKIKEDTGCNIIIKGKGSLRSGMTGITKDGKKVDGLDDPLHAFITASSSENVQKGVKKVKEIIEMQIYDPNSEQAVALRAKHMHELAVLNGTLKDLDMKCLNCGRYGHKTWQCDERPNFTSATICSACGGVGHITQDCQQRRPGEVFKVRKEANPEELDTEYQAFLADMGIKGEGQSTEKKYVPPMGDLSKAFQGPKVPLMLTNGSSAPGAASAQARAASDPQRAPGLRVLGTSIFGGKLTTMTAGYKSQAELEYERQKKKAENEYNPVPTEWKVEQMEKHINANQDQYIKRLEEVRQRELQAK